MTLRLRLLLVLVGIMAAGLVVADVATYASLRSYLTSQIDTELQQDAIPLGTEIVDSHPFGRSGVVPVFPPPNLWVQVRAPTGDDDGPNEPYPYSPPTLPLDLPGSGSASQSAVFFDAASEGTPNLTYRVLAEPLQVGGVTEGTIVVAIPLNNLHSTLGQLVLIEVLVSAAVLAGLGSLAWWIVRRGLRPLEQMTATAGAIAGGDLSRRIDVDAEDERTEVGQLGAALNTMLTGIEEAFAARAASEERLRLFLADASHELRTPLTSIRGYAEMFDRGARDRPEDLATSMRHIKEEASRMSVLVDELLLLARLDRQRPLVLEPLDLGTVVSAAVDAARVSEPARTIDLVAPAPMAVVGDGLRLRQVVDNLLANAAQHTPPGSPVEVVLRAEGTMACIEVRDHGPGVPLEEQAKIFEPFHRADPTRARATGGAGLGLTIVSAIAHAHGGTAGVVSAGPGAPAGATFWVRLPLAPAGTNGSAAATGAADGRSGAEPPAQDHGQVAATELLPAGAAEDRDPAVPAYPER